MNKFQFMGRLTKDVENRTTTSGTAVASFSIAVNRRYARQDGKREVDFFNLTSFGKTAEFVIKYFEKGQQILVEGRIQNRTWEDTTGAKRYATDFIVEQTYFTGSKQNNEGKSIQDEGEYITIDDTADLPF